MKRVLLFASILTGAVVNAQSITVDDSLHTGDMTDYYVVDSNVAKLSTVTGAAVTWDYSDLAGYNIPANADEVEDASTSTWASDYPDAMYIENFAAGVKTYFSNTPTEMIVEGFVYIDGGNTIKIIYDTDALKALEFPMALGTSYTDPISGTGAADGVGVTASLAGDATVTADGTGSLIVGTTTFTDVIRVKTTESTTGTVSGTGAAVSVYRESYAYYKLDGTNDMPIFRTDSLFADLSLLGDFGFSAAYSSVAVTNYVGVEDIQSVEDFTIFPNPAVNEATVTMGEDVESMTVYNALGEVVYTLANPTVKVVINTGVLESGIYFVELKEGNASSTQKLIVK